MVSLAKQAAASLAKGSFVVVYDGDGREEEADLMFHPKFSTAENVERLRREAGGLICIAIGQEQAQALGLGFMSDLLLDSGYGKLVPERTAYGDKPAFSLAINHREVYTGIPDCDRALTIKEFEGLLARKDARDYFQKNFYSPGHVFLLISRGIGNRRGHTELGVELAKMAGLSPAMVMCEMLSKGRAMNRKEAMDYAKKNGLLFLEGKDISGK